MKLTRPLLLLLAAAPLAGQSVEPRLAGRVPPAAIPLVDSLVAVAVAESLPTEPLVQKALEGGAKGMPVDRLVNGVRRSLVQLRDARAILSRAAPERTGADGDLAAVSAALSRGLTPPLVERLLSALPSESPGPMLHAAADLAGHGFPPDSAADLLVAAAGKGLRGVRMLDVAAAASQELQRGRTPSEALSRVRGMLPNVPVAVTHRPARGS